MECVFCKIINKQIPTEIVYEDEDFISFPDISPKAKFHFLIVPKKHTSSIAEAGYDDKNLLGGMILVAKKIAKDKNLNGFKLIINTGKEVGQTVEHLHLHLISGNISETP
jgi:histidine triad (HIT) family protein